MGRVGRISAARLLEEARKDEKRAQYRTCMAQSYMAEWYEARGDKAEAATLQAAVQANCSAAAP